MLEYGKRYDWNLISKTYPDMYAIITDAKKDRGAIINCVLLEIVPYEQEEDTVCKYMDEGKSFDCVRTTYAGPNVGVLC